MAVAVLERAAARRPRPAPAVWGVLAGAAVVVAAVVVGDAENGAGRPWKLPAAPFAGSWDGRLPPLAVVPAGLAAALVLAGPRLAARLPWRWLLAATAAGAAAWAVALAGVNGDGWGELTRPLLSRHDYLHDLPKVTSPGALFAGFTDDLGRWVTHVKAHPPGLLAVLWVLDRAGLGGAGWAAALYIGAGASSVPAALLAAREMAGESLARRAAPYLVLAPAWLWVATSADALFLGVSAWGVALVAVATGRRRRPAVVLAAGGGAVLGGALLLTYGAAPLLIVPAVVVVARRRLDVALAAAAGSVVPLLVAGAAGFWWHEGLRALHPVYESGVARHRPSWYFLWANLAVLAVAVGPAAVGGLATLRDRRLWLLCGGALAAVLAADVSGLSRGEVERIWLPFTPWLVLAAAALPVAAHRRRTWLAAQAGTGLALQLLLRSWW